MNLSGGRQPSYFLAAIGTESRMQVAVEREPALRGRGPDETTTALRCGPSDCRIITSARTAVATTPRTEELILILHGELYANSGPTSAAGCLDAYERQGMEFVSALNGSFVLAVFDGRSGRAFFATDRVNSRKLLFGEHGGLAWFSTQHTFDRHPVSGKPDPAGIAHCLVNGVPMNGRTPFEGVRVLDRASIHEVHQTTVTSRSYWRYEPQTRPSVDAESIRGDLRDALMASVERRLPASGDVCISLSGGYDSAAVLGALSRLGVSDVQCVTYRKPTESKRSDASVARKMAAIAGFAHAEIEAYEDDLDAVTEENLRWGHGLLRLVVETDTWRTLRGLLPADRRTTFWVADECLGMNPPRTLRDHGDVLNSLAFGGWDSLGSLQNVLPRAAGTQLHDALEADLESMLKVSGSIRDLYALRGYLYFDQRLPRLLSWREAFAEPLGEVMNPLVDNDILEIRQRFPRRASLGKSLYKETVTEMFPDLFAVERAAAGAWFAGHWCRDTVRRHSDRLVATVRATESPLDSYLPPEALVRVIDREASRAGARRRLIRKGRTYWGRFRKGLRTIGRPHPAPLRPQPATVDPAVFVLRAVLLRELFRRRDGSRIP